MFKKVFTAILLFQMVTIVVAQKRRLPKLIDVYLIGGQSNATGQGSLANLPAGFLIDSTVLIFNSGKPHLNSGAGSNTWHPLQQASESPDRFGPEIGFGNRMKQVFPKQRIAIIKHAHSGTNLYKDWWPGADLNDTAKWGNQLKVFLETVTDGMTQLMQQGYTPVIRGMLWQQGESDGDKTAAIALAYGKNLNIFIQRIRSELDEPEMLFVYGYVLPPPVIYAFGSEIRKGQFLVNENSADSLSVKGALLVSTENLSRRATDKGSPYPNDYLHFGTDGTLQLGIRMANAMADALNKRIK